jgi:hypothetical protein
MTMKKLILIALFLIAPVALADGVATVLSTTSTVTASNNGAKRALSRGSSLSVGDSIDTGANAKTNIKYKNGTFVSIGSGSHYTILAFSLIKSGIEIKAELTKGKIASKTTHKTKESLKTPVIALAILGTTYGVAIAAADSQETFIKVTDGTVEARGERITGGESVLATASDITPAPFPANDMFEAVSHSEQEDKSSGTGGDGSGTVSDSDSNSGSDTEADTGVEVDAEADVDVDVDTDTDTGGDDAVALIDSSLITAESLEGELELEEEIELEFEPH